MAKYTATVQRVETNTTSFVIEGATKEDALQRALRFAESLDTEEFLVATWKDKVVKLEPLKESNDNDSL